MDDVNYAYTPYYCHPPLHCTEFVDYIEGKQSLSFHSYCFAKQIFIGNFYASTTKWILNLLTCYKCRQADLTKCEQHKETERQHRQTVHWF